MADIIEEGQITEKWKDINGYGGLYQISSFGRVKTVEHKAPNKHGMRTVRERILKQYFSRKDGKGYLQVVIPSAEGKQTALKIHRLVAEHFIPSPDVKEQVNHIDGDRANNRVDNLEWLSPIENTSHAWKNGLCEPRNSRPVINDTTGERFNSVAEAARHYNGKSGTIHECLSGRSQTALGYTWRYA